MRLYLSSFRIGNHASRLVEMVRSGRRALIVMNACDFHMPEARKARLLEEQSALQELDFETEELDLRDYFEQSKPERLEALLRTTDLLWVRGGNIFVLLRAMRQSGLHRILPRLLQEDCFVYGGYSAGIDMLAPNVQGTELVDDPHDVPDKYDKEIVWEGLGLLPFVIAPHYRSEHPESAAIERLVQYYIDNHIPFVALRDGQVIVRENTERFEVLA